MKGWHSSREPADDAAGRMQGECDSARAASSRVGAGQRGPSGRLAWPQAVVAAFGLALGAGAAEGRLNLRSDGTHLWVQVQGDPQDEWRLETSGDLATWSAAPALGTVFANDAARAASLPLGTAPQAWQFYRALRTEGLYDPALLRAVSLTFTQSNWQTLLTNGRNTGSNTLATLELDNGLTVVGVGARYKGNTSFTGFGGSAPTKKSINLDLDFTNATARVMGYKTLNLNNAYGDESIMREPLYFNLMRQYAICPKASLVKLNISGVYWGVYAFVQQQNSDLVNEWFSSNDGDRWKAPNMGGAPGGPGGGGSSGVSALSYLGTNVATYKSNYELKTDNSTNAWERLIHAVTVLNQTPAAQLRDAVEDVLAVDRWLWFLALENILADDDSYWNKGADYQFYYEPESGRIHPIEHDGNEAFTARDVQLSPVQGATSSNRPVLYRLLSNAELRQRYLAHMRTALAESFNPTALLPVVQAYSTLSHAAIVADTKKNYTMAAYTNDLNALKSFIQQPHTYLTNHAELRPRPPSILAVQGPTPAPTARTEAAVTTHVSPHGTEGIGSVWLYHRGKSYGRFAVVQMHDDGAHGDGLANDGVFGASIQPYPAGTRVRYYVEARSGNATKTAAFAPARAEEQTHSYRVALTTASSTPVVIHELMASNTKTIADPQGEYDDWIELLNLTDQEVDLSGWHLSDEPNNPRKWAFPAGTTIAAGGYLLVWADEDGGDSPGLHASFKLAAAGEQLFLTDTDANYNAILDSVEFGPQEPDRSYGRSAAAPTVFASMTPTPGGPNQ